MVLTNLALGCQKAKDLGVEVHNWGLDRGALDFSNFLRFWCVLRNLLRLVRPNPVTAASLEASVIARAASFGWRQIVCLATLGAGQSHGENLR